MSGYVTAMLEDAIQALACADALNPSPLQADLLSAARRHILRAAAELAPAVEETLPSPIAHVPEDQETVVTSSSGRGGSAYNLFVSAMVPVLRSSNPGVGQRQILTMAAGLWRRHKNPRATLKEVVDSARAEISRAGAGGGSTFRSVSLDDEMPPLEESS